MYFTEYTNSAACNDTMCLFCSTPTTAHVSHLFPTASVQAVPASAGAGLLTPTPAQIHPCHKPETPDTAKLLQRALAGSATSVMHSLSQTSTNQPSDNSASSSQYSALQPRHANISLALQTLHQPSGTSAVESSSTCGLSTSSQAASGSTGAKMQGIRHTVIDHPSTSQLNNPLTAIQASAGVQSRQAAHLGLGSAVNALHKHSVVLSLHDKQHAAAVQHSSGEAHAASAVHASAAPYTLPYSEATAQLPVSAAGAIHTMQQHRTSKVPITTAEGVHTANVSKPAAAVAAISCGHMAQPAEQVALRQMRDGFRAAAQPAEHGVPADDATLIAPQVSALVAQNMKALGAV